MGLVASRLNLDSLHVGGLVGRSQQDEVCFSYSLNKNYFSNYFLMGGERYDVSDPDYLFGDNCDLNFLGCNKPYSIPYKKAQQYLLTTLKQSKSCNKASSRVAARLSSPLSILTAASGGGGGNNNQSSTDQHSHNHHHHQHHSSNQRQSQQSTTTTPHDLRKHDVRQTQNLTSRSSSSASSDPAQPLVMLVNIRKETIRLTRSPTKPESSKYDHEVSSLLSATSSTRSGYTSVKGEGIHASEDEDDDDEFKDALRGGDDDDESDKAQQHESLLPSGARSPKEDSDIRITIEDTNAGEGPSTRPASFGDNRSVDDSGPDKQQKTCPRVSDNRVYNIEFSFDTEVDCSMRIFYFCTRETTSTGITYKPLHATYKSKVYYYKKGLNQKFDQPEHTFQPCLFDEDLLIYKPLDTEGNYNSGSVFPIVIQCVALEGPTPRQSHSLVATIEKSQLDGSYSIKPLKQLIFADGIQFILQDIYGIELKKQPKPVSSSSGARKCNRSDSTSSTAAAAAAAATAATGASAGGLKYKSHSMQSNLNKSTTNLSDTTSVSGMECSLSSRGLNRGSTSSTNQHRSLGGENTFECVICISEERDTMLLPCRHLCLCISCAQSLRYQANSCPICRSPFRAALNIRRSSTTTTTTATATTNAITTTTTTAGAATATAHSPDKEDLGRN